MPLTRLASRPTGRTTPRTTRAPQLDISGIADNPAWQDEGLCRQTDPELFFPTRGQSSTDAVKVCNRCPVKARCLEWALETDQEFGIWGGLGAKARKKLKRQKEGRPTRGRAAAQRIIEAGAKECPRCLTTKPLAEFPKDAKSLTGHGPTCKACRAMLEARGRAIKAMGLTPERVESSKTLRARQRLADAA